MQRQTGDQAFELAEEGYKSGSYGQAIALFDQYLEKYPKHGSVSTAKVHRGLAEMRQAAEGAGDWSKTLATTQTAPIRFLRRSNFRRADRSCLDLARVGPRHIDAGPGKTKCHTRGSNSREAVALVDKFVPVTLNLPKRSATSLRRWRLRSEARSSQALAASIGKMQEAIQADKLPDVYAARRDLLQNPGTR